LNARFARDRLAQLPLGQAEAAARAATDFACAADDAAAHHRRRGLGRFFLDGHGQTGVGGTGGRLCRAGISDAPAVVRGRLGWGIEVVQVGTRSSAIAEWRRRIFARHGLDRQGIAGLDAIDGHLIDGHLRKCRRGGCGRAGRFGRGGGQVPQEQACGEQA
jgi:hypothetical protein